ncbi:MAG: hypothetical protein Kapaf2KO_22480 [Candidatus Kapaibacteriales bacterium]
MLSKYLTVALVFIIAQLSYSQLIINEVCTSNDISLTDSYGESPDWVELLNISDKSIELSEYRVSDKNSMEEAWQLPSITLSPRERILVYCDGKAQNGSNAITIESESYGSYYWHKGEWVPFVYSEVNGDFEISVDVRNFENLAKWGNVGLAFFKELEHSSEYISINMVDRIKNRDVGNFIVYFRTEESGHSESDIDIHYNFDPLIYTMVLRKKSNLIEFELIDDVGRSGFLRTYPNEQFDKINAGEWDSGFVGLTLSQNKGSLDTNLPKAKVTFENLKINGRSVEFDEMKTLDFTDDKNSLIYRDEEIHTDFALSSKGETVYLWKGDAISDSIEVPRLMADIAYGRSGANLLPFSDASLLMEPTPDDPNSADAKGFVEKFNPSEKAGVYADYIELFMEEGDAEATYRYTINGSKPTSDSPIFDGFLPITDNTPLRVIGFRDGFLPSEEFAGTYLIDVEEGLPIYSIIADSLELWDEEEGLVSNRDKIHLSVDGYFEDFESRSAWPTKINIQGGTSRYYEQPSFQVEIKGAFDNDFGEDFFENGFDKHSDLVLKNHSTGSRWSLFTNQAAHLASKNLNVINTQFIPSIRYLNGKYDGLITLTDRVNRKYLSEYLDIEEEQIVYIDEYLKSVKGNKNQALERLDLIMETELDNDYGGYNRFDSLVNIGNFYDYYIANIMLYNYDWTEHNFKMFFSKDYDDGRLNFLLTDMDWTFGVAYVESHYNFFERLDSNFFIGNLFKSAMNNLDLRNGFINRFCDLIQTEFSHDRLISLVDSLTEIYRPHISKHRELYSTSASVWEESVGRMKHFVKSRDYWIYFHIQDHFNLSGINHINLSTSHPGNSRIQLSGLEHSSFPIYLKYLNNVPIKLKAIPSKGYEFVRWEGIDNEYSSELEIVLVGDSTNIRAIFESTNEIDAIDPVITEIMYAAPQDNDSGDWIEIYNPDRSPIDFSGWMVTDSRDKDFFVIPENTIIDSGGYAILSDNLNDFESVYGNNIPNVIGELGFGLSREGDMILLFRPDSTVADSVSYSVGGEWPDANRNGKSISLIDWRLDNSLGINWSQSIDSMGGPGTGIFSIREDDQPNEIIAQKSQRYMIRIGNSLNLSNLYDGSIIRWTLYDMNGNLIKNGDGITLVTKGLAFGLYNIMMEDKKGKESVLTIMLTE